MLKEKIKAFKGKLRVWNREQFGDTLKKYKKIEEDLNKLEEDTTDRHLNHHELVTRKQLQEQL